MDTQASSFASNITVKHLGCVDYNDTVAAMQAFTAARTETTPDELWVLTHPPVFTLGQAGLDSHLLHASDIPLIQTDRGGQITYHGPGQLVVYMLLDLKRRGLMIREWVRRIEGAIILTLAHYGVASERHTGAPGIYIQAHGTQTHVGAKIAALGLKVKHGCTYHGLSLNVAMDLSPFLQINPCGYAGLETVDLRGMGMEVSIDTAARDVTHYLTQQWLSHNGLPEPYNQHPTQPHWTPKS